MRAIPVDPQSTGHPPHPAAPPAIGVLPLCLGTGRKWGSAAEGNGATQGDSKIGSLGVLCLRMIQRSSTESVGQSFGRRSCGERGARREWEVERELRE